VGSEVLRWDPARDGPLAESALWRKLERLGYRVARYVYAPGTTFSPHAHPVDKIDAVVRGRFRVAFASGEEALLEAGDAIEIPRGVRHEAEVVGDEPVIALDAVRG
jgi:quercetin dioxygenase-like cupin family protein